MAFISSLFVGEFVDHNYSWFSPAVVVVVCIMKLLSLVLLIRAYDHTLYNILYSIIFWHRKIVMLKKLKGKY